MYVAHFSSAPFAVYLEFRSIPASLRRLPNLSPLNSDVFQPSIRAYSSDIETICQQFALSRLICAR
jgi:hypothetical protein